MKGIVLAAGRGKRLYPVTKICSKPLLPVYDKPMVYYSLSVLMLAGIREILLITNPQSLEPFKVLLGDGSELGIKIEYEVQHEAKGIAHAFLLGEKFIGNDKSCLIFGDNIFYGHGFSDLLKAAMKKKEGATVFGYCVKNPEQYGVIEFDENNRVISLEEKPKKPKSNWVVTGLYFFDNTAIAKAKTLTPSARGELEITDLNNLYLKEKKLQVVLLDRGFAWLDTGTYASIVSASTFMLTIEERQGLKIGCLEEIAYRMGYIDAKQLKKSALASEESYKNYLLKLLR